MIQELTKRRPVVCGHGREVGVRCLDPQRLEVTHPCLDELLGTVAHELHSPLAAVIGGVRLINSECELGPFAGPLLAGMETQLSHAMRLVDDLFDLCAGGLGKLTLHKQVVALKDVVERATDAAKGLLSARQHQLTVSLPPEPIFLEADPLRLTQVLTNLLCNAAKFTDPGGHIRLSAVADDAQIVLRIRDNGRGIPADRLPRMFELFQQIPGRPAERTGGMGIGLALVKSLVERHGGCITALSDGPGTGSEFIVRLPVHAD